MNHVSMQFLLVIDLEHGVFYFINTSVAFPNSNLLGESDQLLSWNKGFSMKHNPE